MSHRVQYSVVLALALTGPACRGAASSGEVPPGTPVKIQVAHAAAVDDTTRIRGHPEVARLRRRSCRRSRDRSREIFVRSGDRVARGRAARADRPRQAAGHGEEPGGHARGQRAALEYARQQYDRVSGLFADRASPASRTWTRPRPALDAAAGRAAGGRARRSASSRRSCATTAWRPRPPGSWATSRCGWATGSRSPPLLTTVDSRGGLEAYVSVPVERAAQLRHGDAGAHPGRGGRGGGREPHHVRLARRSTTRPRPCSSRPRVDERRGTLRPAQFIRARMVWGTREGPLVPGAGRLPHQRPVLRVRGGGREGRAWWRGSGR